MKICDILPFCSYKPTSSENCVSIIVSKDIGADTYKLSCYGGAVHCLCVCCMYSTICLMPKFRPPNILVTLLYSLLHQENMSV